MTENVEQQEKWDKSILGESAPDDNDPIAQKAHAVRQMILWESAQAEKDLIPPHQASAFYRQVYRVNRKRQWMKRGLAGILILAIAVMAYFSMRTPTLVSHDQVADIDPKNFLTEETISDMPYMLTIPEGTYTMGCENGWDDKIGSCNSSEKPPHEVNVKAFALSKYETTLGQFKKFVAETDYVTTAETDNAGCTVNGEVAGKEVEWVLSKEHHWKNPGFDQDDNHPVVCISWLDAQAYIAWISKKTGISYRLPTEEEWEYAARSGEITMYYWGHIADRSFANYRGVAEADVWEYTAPVGELGANNFGTHDMSGNAWEWIDSCWRPNYKSECTDENIKTRRGGSWLDSPRNIRMAYRNSHRKGVRSFLHGFRVAHDLKKNQ